MIHAKLNIIPLLLSGFIALTSCSTAKGPFGQVDDDVYFSRKQSHTKDVYVPEVDVQEIIKANPPQYGTDAPTQRYNDYNSGGNNNFNYDEYKTQQEQTPQGDVQDNNTFLNTVPYVGQEEEAAEASRLRMQYSGNYNTYNTYNYYNDPGYNYNGYGNGYNNYYNNWYTPSVNIGFSNWGGWGVGIGWGWSSGYGYGWPHYNPYWGGAYGYYNPWAWNSWYSPWPYYYGNCWGYNNWCGPYGGYGYYPGNWGYNQYAERAASRTVRPRQSAGSSLPRGENMQPRGSGMTGQAPSTPNTGRAMPRNPQQGQLINRDGQQIYVAPEQNRTTPRTYNTYDRSVRNGQIQRDVTPAPQQPVTPRSYGTPPPPSGNYRGGNNGQYQQQPQQPQRLQPVMPQRNSNPAPAPTQPAPRSYSPAPSAPSSPGTISPPSGGGGGGRGSSGSSGSGGGGRTMPRR